MKKITIIGLLLLFFNNAIAQELIFVGDKAYQATQRWFFNGNGGQFEVYANDATLQIGKNGTTGIFSISTKIFDSASGIKGSIRIYLDNAETIVLSTPIGRDFVDGYYTVIFSIPTSTLSKLKTSNINTVRFNTGYAGQLKGSTASNEWDSNPDPIVYHKKIWKTAEEITQLFK